METLRKKQRQKKAQECNFTIKIVTNFDWFDPSRRFSCYKLKIPPYSPELQVGWIYHPNRVLGLDFYKRPKDTVISMA